LANRLPLLEASWQTLLKGNAYATRRMLVSGEAGKSKESGNDEAAQASQKIRRADPFYLGSGKKNY